MIARLPAVARVGLALVLIGPAWYGVWAAWDSTRIWKPLDVPISLAPGHIRTTEFTTNVSGMYSADVELTEPPDVDLRTTFCQLGAAQCDDVPSIVEIHWSLGDGIRRTAPAAFGLCTLCRRLGVFHSSGGKQVLRLDVLRDGSLFSKLHPRLVVREIGGKRQRAAAEMERGVWLFLILTPIGAVLLLRLTLRWLLGPTGALGRVSLTQPLPIFQAPPLDTVTPWRTRSQFSRRRSSAPNQPLFRRASWVSLTMVLCYLMIYLPVWVLASQEYVPAGFYIHLWRPGAASITVPNMPAIVVRLEGATGPYWARKPPRVYVDSEIVNSDELAAVLRRKLAQRPPGWSVYLDGDDTIEWGDAVRVIDMLRGFGANVILLKHQQKAVKMRDH